MLHCGGINEVPGGGEHTTFRHIIVHDVKLESYFGFDAHHGSRVAEMGLVMDGATCGPGSYCKGQNCTFFQDLGFDCNVKKCSYRGVCSNRKHCHCQQGGKPPNCSSRGAGGSIDSGPPPNRESGLRGKIITSVDMGIAALCVRFTVLFSTMFVGIIFHVKDVIEEREEEKNVKNQKNLEQKKH